MNRPIQVQDQVRAQLGQIFEIFVITQIQVPYIYIQNERSSRVIQITPSNELKMVGQEDLPYTFEFFSPPEVVQLPGSIDLSPIDNFPELQQLLRKFISRYQAYYQEVSPELANKNFTLKSEIFQGQPYLGIYDDSAHKHRIFRIHPQTFDILTPTGKKPVANLKSDDYVFFSLGGIRNLNDKMFSLQGKYPDSLREQNQIWSKYGLDR